MKRHTPHCKIKTLCFDLKITGMSSGQASACLEKQYAQIAEALGEKYDVRVEAMATIRKHNEPILFRSRIHIQCEENTPELAKPIIKQFINPYFFIVDFLAKPRAVTEDAPAQIQ